MVRGATDRMARLKVSALGDLIEHRRGPNDWA
jgi:hypothetical protein